MEKMRRFLEVGANISIILVALLLGTGITLKYLAPAPASGDKDRPQIVENTKFNLSGVDWSKSEKNLVLAFSTKCRFCIESTSFYERLAERKAFGSNVRIIVVSPQPVDEVKGFFQERSIAADEFAQAQLSDISISGTPTLVLVGSDGLVKGSWVGKLPPDAEAELIAKIF